MDNVDEGYVEQVRAILSEHFPNFAFVVMDEDGEPYYDYTNWRIGRMLFKESIEDMESEPLGEVDVWWDEWEDDDGEEWKHD